MAFCISLATAAFSDDIRHTLPRLGIPVLRYCHDRYTAYTPPRIKFRLLVGSDFILYLRFSFPVMAMNPVLQALSNLFPLRHYFLIYVDQALNGYSMAYSWSNYMALLIFMMLPFFVVHRLKEALVYYKYIP